MVAELDLQHYQVKVGYLGFMNQYFICVQLIESSCFVHYNLLLSAHSALYSAHFCHYALILPRILAIECILSSCLLSFATHLAHSPLNSAHPAATYRPHSPHSATHNHAFRALRALQA